MKRSQKGFGVVEGIFILVVVGILGFVGWYVWQSKNNTDNTLNVADSTSNSATKSPDPYSGWKQYCSKLGNVCFKYPTNWTASTTQPSTSDESDLSVDSPSNQVNIYYNPSLQGIGGACQPGVCAIDVLSISTPAASSAGNLRIVKAVFVDNSALPGAVYSPSFCLTDKNYLSKLKLKSGMQDIGAVIFFFQNPKTTGIESMCASQSSATGAFNSVNDVKVWFENADVITAGQVLNSIQLQ